MPEYMNDPIYQELVALCESAGIKIEYKKLDERIYAHTDKYTCIEMSDSEIYDSSEHAAKVLGHELSHIVLERMSNDDVHDEDLCDKMGDGLYVLAEMTAMHKADSIWKG